MPLPVANPVWNLVLAAAIACGGAACSLAFVNGPPPNHRQLPFFDCTSSNLLPTVDLLFAGAAAVDAVGGTAGASGLPSSRTELAGFAVEAAAFAASAVYGYGKTSACKKAQGELFARTPSTPMLSYPPGYGTAPGFGPPAAPYDPWVAPRLPANPPPPALSPVGPPPPAVAAPATAAPDGKTPVWEKPAQ
jgi:hypothetical protein